MSSNTETLTNYIKETKIIFSEGHDEAASVIFLGMQIIFFKKYFFLLWNRTLFNNLFNQIFSSSGEKCRNKALRFHFSLQLSKSGVVVEGSLNPDVYLFRYLTLTYILTFLKVSKTHRHWALNLAFHCLPANTQGTADRTSRAAAYCVSLAQWKWKAVVNSPIC